MTEILWRPMPTVATKAQADKVAEAIKTGENYGMFVPAGSAMAADILQLRLSNPGHRPYIAQAAINAGLLSPESALYRKATFTDGGSIASIGTSADFTDVHFDLDEKFGPQMNFHRTYLGKVLGLLLRPTAKFDGYASTVLRPISSREQEVLNKQTRQKYHQLVSGEILRGVIDKAPIEPVIEIAIAGPDDIIVTMENTPVNPGINALPTPHWFIPLTDKRESTAMLWNSRPSPEFPTHLSPVG